MKKNLLTLLTTVTSAFTVGVGALAFLLVRWGAFDNQRQYINGMQEFMRWTKTEANWSFTYRYEILYGTAALLIVSVIVLFLLLAMAGHKKGQEGIVLRWQDKIPLDLYAAIVTCLEVVFVVLVIVCLENSWSPLSLMGTVGFSAMPAAFVAIHALMSLAIRVKAGKWWRNTVCYRVLAWCWSFLKKCLFGAGKMTADGMHLVAETIGMLPLVWKVVVAMVLVILANLFFFLCILSFYGFGRVIASVLWFLVNVACIFALIHLLKQMLLLKEGAQRIGSGDMEFQIETKGMIKEFRQHGEILNHLREGLNQAVEQRMKSERLKTELITNVSHDIKTPLTSIINYVDLLQKEPLEGTALEYVEVLSRQSGRLKRLIENLVEASKASTGNIKVNLQKIGVCEFIHQVVAEYADRLEAQQLRPVVSVPEEERYILADGRHLWRVFDNLLNNICKYTLEGTRVYVDVHEQGGEVQIVFKNISKECLNIAADELMERFVRGDSSRNTEGSGLGLSIAQSLTQAQKGSFDLFVDGDLFKAVICFPSVSAENGLTEA